MRAVVTGCAGFIGSHIAEALLREGYEVIGFDNFSTGKEMNMHKFIEHKNFTFVFTDVNNVDWINVLWGWTIDAFFHYAACVGVERTISNPELVLEDTKFFNHLNEALDNHQFNIGHFIYASSSEVYGSCDDGSVDEQAPIKCDSEYQTMKRIGEHYTKGLTDFDVSWTILRLFNTYGPRQSPDFVMSRFCIRAIEGAPLEILGGSQTRAFLHVDDHRAFVIDAVLNNGLFYDSVVNVGSDEELTIGELALTIKEVAEKEGHEQVVIKQLDARLKGDMKRRSCSNDFMMEAYQDSLIDLDDGIKSVLRWYKLIDKLRDNDI